MMIVSESGQTQYKEKPKGWASVNLLKTFNNSRPNDCRSIHCSLQQNDAERQRLAAVARYLTSSARRRGRPCPEPNR